MEYKEDDYLQLSGIQHFRFCRRQWGLIHIENLWQENTRTTEGRFLHERAHDNSLNESRGNMFIRRGVRVFSSNLGVSGECDVLEYHKSEDGIPVKGRMGKYSIYPIEYKRGKPRDDLANELQLCGQAMCLEEMLCCDIPKGALYYGEIRRREEVVFDSDLRDLVRSTLKEMHMLYDRGHTPMVKYNKSCKSCSLNGECMPLMNSTSTVKEYIMGHLD